MKKDETRFTLRFCSVAPKHINAAHILNIAGRRKASLIADLIDEHIKQYGENAFADYLHNTTFSQTATHVEIVTAQISEPSVKAKKHIASSTKPEKPLEPSNNKSLDDEMRDTILDGLSLFSKA